MTEFITENSSCKSGHWTSTTKGVMMILGRYEKLAFLMVLFISILVMLPIAALAVPTEIGGDVSDTTTGEWTLTGSPYTVTAGVSVPAGQTLTIHPGVTVKFNQGSGMIVAGTLKAVGGGTDWITFTTIGAAATEWWPSIWFQHDGSGILNQCRMQYGGGQPDIAILCESSSDSSQTISNCEISYAGTGILIRGNSEVTVTGNTITNTEWPIVWQHGGSTITDFADNRFESNTYDAFKLGYTGAFSVPQGKEMTLKNYPGAPPYATIGIDVGGEATLTLEPGIVVKFMGGGPMDPAGILAAGTLIARGMANNPIILTAFTDDSVGGDTNGDMGNTSPAPGFWNGVTFKGDPDTSVMDHCKISYTGSWYGSAISSRDYSTPTISNCDIFAAHGSAIVAMWGAKPFISPDNAFTDIMVGDQQGNGVFNQSAETIDATYNWWDSPSGPYHAIKNPNGTGNRVGDRVDFIPFLTSPPTRSGGVTMSVLASQTSLPADGRSTSTITVGVSGANGQPLSGQNVEMWVSSGSGTMSSVIDNGDGTYTATYTASTTPGGETITVSVGGVSQTVGISLQGGGPAIANVSASPTSVRPGEIITATYSGSEGNPNDWIGMFVASAPDGTYVEKRILGSGNTSGILNFTAPQQPGGYNFRLFSQYGPRLAEGNSVVVQGDPQPPQGVVLLSAFPVTVRPFEMITVTYSGAPETGDELIGMYKVGESNNDPIDISFLFASTGSIFFMAEEEGQYIFRLFPDGELSTVLGFSNIVTVSESAQAQPALLASPSAVKSGEIITVLYSGATGETGEWIGMYYMGGGSPSLVQQQFPNFAENGSLYFTAPAQTGNYEFRMFNAQNQQVVASNQVTVSAGTGAQASLTASPESVNPGDSITVTFSGTSGNEYDWIGMYLVGSMNYETYDMDYTNGATSGTMTFTAPDETGFYEFRLFPNDEFDPVLAVSNTVAVGTELPQPQAQPQPSLSASPASIGVAQKITVTYSNAPGNSGEWVGTFAVGSPSTSSLSQKSLNGSKNGTLTFSAPVTPGKYEFRLLNAQNQQLAVSNSVQVVGELPPQLQSTVSASPASLKSGETITVTYSNAPGDPGEWIGMYYTGGQTPSLVEQKSLNGIVNGTLSFTAPTQTGSYEFRMINVQSRQLAVSNTITVTGGQQPGGREFVIPEVTAAPGESVTVPINITDASTVAGADIEVNYDANILTVSEVRSTALTSGMNVITNTNTPGTIILRIAVGNGLSSGSGAFVDMIFTVSASAVSGTETPVTFASAEAFDEVGQNIAIGTQNGKVKIGLACIKGDVNGNGEVRSNDAVMALRISAGLLTPTARQLCAANMNTDDLVKSNDAILILRKSAGLMAPDRGDMVVSDRIVTVALDGFYGVSDNTIDVPLRVDNPGIIAGADIYITYDSSVLRAVSVSSEGGIMMASNVGEPGEVRISLASATGLKSDTLAHVRFQVLADSRSPLTLGSVRLYDLDALPLVSRPVDSQFISYMMAPERSNLLQNFPNPFNPETWIPYQLREDAPVTIRIYSLSGELVRGLSLGSKSAGVYVSTDRAAHWDGRNEAGESVASGIYFYNIQAGELTATRKMVVAK